MALEVPHAGRSAEFVEACRRSRRLHHPWVRPPTTPADFRAYLERRARDDQPGYWLVDRGTDALVGAVNLNNLVRGALQSAALGYYVFRPYEGQGWMREGLARVCREAFGRLRLHRLEANIQPANEASIRLVRGLGFEREGLSPRFLKVGGRWRDHERWALTVESWRAHRSQARPDRVSRGR